MSCKNTSMRTCVEDDLISASNFKILFDKSARALVYFFFFQAEDGIRDYKVTGVQTCALPISQQALGAAIARRRVEPGKERPVDRHGAELDLAVGQHASEHVATVGLVAARVVTRPADRASVPREPAEPGRLPARAVADVDPEHAAAFGQPASTPHVMDSRYAARTASLHAP